MTIGELRSEALEEIGNSELEDIAIFSNNNFSDDDSFFDSDNENKFECMDDDVFLSNIRERHINSDSFEPTTKNKMKVGKHRFNGLITYEYIASGPCMPYYSK